MVNIQMGAEADFNGVIDLVKWRAIYNEGEKGYVLTEVPPPCSAITEGARHFVLLRINVTSGEIPAEFMDAAIAKRAELVETLAEVDDEIADAWLEEREIAPDELAVSRRDASPIITPVLTPAHL
jgi:elongation factor G